MKKSLFLLLIAALLTPLAFSQATWYGNVCQSMTYINGVRVVQPLPGSSVLICTYGSTCDAGHAATIYTDNTAVTPAANPVISDNQGNFGFWALPGTYQYSCTYKGATSGPYTATAGVNDNIVVHNIGNESIAGIKTFTSPIVGSVTGNAGTASQVISSTANPSSTGAVRLAKTDAISFRNTANSGDIQALANNSDSIQIGDATHNVLTPSSVITLNGSLGVNIQYVTAGQTLSILSSGQSNPLSLSSGSRGVGSGNGGDITLTAGNGGTSGGSGGNVIINPGTASFGTAGSVQVNSTVSKYNSIATAGQGISAIFGATSQKAETAADTNVLTFTPPAVAGTYRITFELSLSAANTATLGWTATWKDSNGNAQAPTNLSLFQQGTAAPALTFTTSSTGNYYASATIDVDNSATAVVVKLTFTGTSFAGKASATVERLQ